MELASLSPQSSLARLLNSHVEHLKRTNKRKSKHVEGKTIREQQNETKGTTLPVSVGGLGQTACPTTCADICICYVLTIKRDYLVSVHKGLQSQTVHSQFIQATFAAESIIQQTASG